MTQADVKYFLKNPGRNMTVPRFIGFGHVIAPRYAWRHGGNQLTIKSIKVNGIWTSVYSVAMNNGEILNFTSHSSECSEVYGENQIRGQIFFQIIL